MLSLIHISYSTGAGFTETALGVSAWQYGPFTFFGWLNPLVSLTIALLGKSMPHVETADTPEQTETGKEQAK